MALKLLKNSVKVNHGGVAVFGKIRNEKSRVQTFLQTYREMGIERFYLVDNCSTDGTRETLLAQPDVVLFSTDECLSKHDVWINELLNRFGQGRWCLVVDTDEVFRFPHDEAYSLSDLLRFLDSLGYDAMEARLLDMYADKPIWSVHSPMSECCYFDRKGNVRHRVFGTNNCIWKVPLFKYRSGMSLSIGAHKLHNARLSKTTGALLHYKFNREFFSLVERALKERNYYKSSIEYESYAQVLKKNRYLNLHSKTDSVHFRRMRDLLEYELVSVEKGYMRSNGFLSMLQYYLIPIFRLVYFLRGRTI